MSKTARIWVWAIIIGIVLILAGSLLFLGNNAPPPATFDLSNPNIIGITQGTEGSFEALEIGVTFVDADSAGVSLYSTTTGEPAQNFAIDVGDSVDYAGYAIELLDTQSATDSAVLQIQPIE